MFLAGLPFGAGEDARGHLDQARREFEDAGGGPGPAVAGAILAHIQGIGHAGERNVLDDHFGEKLERLQFQGVILEMAAVGGDPKAKRDFFGSGGDFTLFGFGRTLSFSRIRSIFFTAPP